MQGIIKDWKRLRHLRSVRIAIQFSAEPAHLANHPESYDLGEFDQKGSVATKWGTKEELLKLAHTAKDNGVGIYWDAVLNHKFAADRKEKCLAAEVDSDDRTKFVSDKYEIDAWVGYDFPGRKGKYSEQKYHWYHFSGVDYNARNEKTAIYKILGDKGDQQWAESVDDEKGN